MKQELKSQRSRELILDTALNLFSENGYKATSIKDIAGRANISAGRVYHHFENKLQIFTTLIDHYWSRLNDPELELNQIMFRAAFPDDLADIARAIGKVVNDNRRYIMLIYIDVIEFRGEHIERVYRGMADRFREVYAERFEKLKAEGVINADADPYFAVMMTVRFFFQYFLVETSFGVKEHFGMDAEKVIEKTRDIVLHGLLKQGAGDKGGDA